MQVDWKGCLAIIFADGCCISMYMYINYLVALWRIPLTSFTTMMVWQGSYCLPSWHLLFSAHLFVWFSWAKRRLISLVSFVPGIPLGSLCVALRLLQGTIAQKLLVDLKALSLQTGDLGCTFVLGCLSFLLERHHGRCSLQAQDAPEKKGAVLPSFRDRIRNLLAKFGFIGRFLKYSDSGPWQVVRPL